MNDATSAASPLLSTSDPRVGAAIAQPVSRRVGDDTATRMLRSAFQAFGEVTPTLFAWAAYRLFTQPRRFATPAREREHAALAERFVVDSPVGALQAYRWRQSDLPWEAGRSRGTVLLAHGWEGRGTQLCAFVDALNAAGFDVVAYDGPAHGASRENDRGGDRADVATFSIAVHAVAAAVSDVRAVIGHSMGAGAVALAVADGLDVDAVALLAPPVSVAAVTADFCRALGTTPRTEQVLKKKLGERFHPYLWHKANFDGAFTDLVGDVAALVVHDVDDAEMPLARGHAVAAAWPGAQFLPTVGLGHRRVLRDPAVVDAVVAFVSARVRPH